MWVIFANVLTFEDGEWRGSRQVPTFFLDERAQGCLTEEHACAVARQVIDPLALIADENLIISATRLPPAGK